MLRLILLAIGSFFLLMPAHAQVCGGSLGDPVLKMTFGRGPTGPIIPPASKTGLIYSGSPCVKDGQFCLATFFFGCSPTIWYSPLAGDHTGTSSVAESLGYFMMVNADVPGKFISQDTATGLDRKSTRLNSSHIPISHAVYCLQKKTDIKCTQAK